MTDTLENQPEDPPKVVTLFSREPFKPAGDAAPAPAAPASSGICTKSVQTMQSTLESIAAGKVGSVCAFGISTSTGLPVFFVTVPEGVNSQRAAVKLLGALRAFETVMTGILFNGVEEDDEK